LGASNEKNQINTKIPRCKISEFFILFTFELEMPYYLRKINYHEIYGDNRQHEKHIPERNGKNLIKH
jgi:hypothetical protein